MNTTATHDVARIVAAFAAQVGDHNRPLALIARFRVRAGAGSQIENAFAEASVHTAEEAGALAYQLHREPENPDPFVVYERWRSLEDLEAHLRTTYVAALRAQIDAVMEGEPSFQAMLPAWEYENALAQQNDTGASVDMTGRLWRKCAEASVLPQSIG